MRKKLLVLAVAGGLLLVPSRALPIPGGLIVFDPTNWGEAVEQVINIIKTLRVLEAQLDHWRWEAQRLGGLGRWRTQISVWDRIRRVSDNGTVNPRVQEVIDAINTGIGAARAYGNFNYGPVVPYRSGHGLLPDVLKRREVDIAGIEAIDASAVGALYAVGQVRSKGPANEQAIRELQFDQTADNPDAHTMTTLAMRGNLINLQSAKIANDNQRMMASLVELNMLRARQERDAAHSALMADIAFREQGPRAIADQIGDPSAALTAFRLH